jgi:hypothetical protein
LNQNDESIGGAIYWLGKNGEVSDSHFSWNVADYGGAIYWDCEADNGLIDNCYFKLEPEDINILASAYGYYYMGNVMEQLGNYSNIAHRGAAIFYDGYNGIISNSVFERNIAVEHGGAISVHGNSTTVSDCQFNNNTIGDLGISSIYSTISPYERGGSSVVWYGNDGKLVNSNFTNHNSNYTVLLWMGEDAHIYTNTMEVDLSYQHKYGNNGLIENCLFRDNHGSIDALVEWIGYNGTISNSEFYNNSAEYYGAVLWFGTDGKIIDTEFARNYGRYAAFLGIGYNTSIVRCTFDENVGILGVVYQGMELEEYNEYTFEIDEFTEYTATSKLLIEDSTFTNNYALVATVIDSSYRSKISNSRFYNNSNYHTALLIMGGESSVDGCNFTDNTGFAGSALMVGYIDVDNSYYFAGSETIGDPYSIIEQFGWDVTVSNSRFTNNTAQLGGAVSWFGLNGTMENSIFIGNGFKEYDYNALLDASENTSSLLYYGQDMEYFHNIFEEAFTAVFKQAAGGAMNWMGVNGLVNNCTFENNSASAENVAEHYGGAVCWQGDDGVIKASTFVNNFASKGGSVFWVGEWGTIANSTFSENRIPSVKTEFKYDNYTAAVYQYFDFDFEYNEYSLEEDKYAAAQAHYDEAYAYVSSSYTYDELEYIWYIASYQEAYCPKAGEGSPAYLEINYVFLLKNHLEFNATTPSFGGAVYWYGEHGLIYNSTFTNNSATQGGAVYWNGYYGGIQDSIFNENTGTSIDAIIFSRELMDPYVHTASAERNVYSEEDCEIVIKELIASEIYNVYGYIIMGIEEGEFNEFTFDVIDVSYYKGEPQVTTQQEIMVNPEYVVTGGNRLTTGEFEPDYYRFEVTFNIRLYNSTYRTGSYKSAGGAVYWNAEDLPEFNPIYPPMPNTPVDPTPGEVVSRSTNPGGNLKAVSDSRDILADDYDDNGDYYDDVVEEQQTGYQPGYIYNCTFIKNSVEEGGAVYWATPEGIID